MHLSFWTQRGERLQQYNEGAVGSENAFELGTQAATTASAALFGRVFTIVIAGIAFVLVARLLGPTQYGIYSVAMAFVAFFTTIGESGMGVTFSKFVAEYSSRNDKKKLAELLLNGYCILLVMCTAFSLIAFALSGFMASYVL